jgi:hypothetical protein
VKRVGPRIYEDQLTQTLQFPQFFSVAANFVMN